MVGRSFAIWVAYILVALVAHSVGGPKVSFAPQSSSSVIAWPTPNLKAGFVPQGMTTWGQYVLMAEYKPGSNTRLVAVSQSNGKVYGQVAISSTHAGGLAIVGGWLYVQNADTVNHDAVRRYRLMDFSAAMAKSHKTKTHPVYIKQAGLQQLAPWQFASFMTTDGSQLLSGHHGVGTGARMYRFDVDQSTGLLTAVNYVMVPENAQGVAAAGTVFTSGGGHLTVAGVVLPIPSHAEGIVVINGTAIIAFEHGAKYVLSFTI